MPLRPAVRRAGMVAPLPGWKAILARVSQSRIPTQVAFRLKGRAEIGFRKGLRQEVVIGE
jgi:hypothetical protein